MLVGRSACAAPLLSPSHPNSVFYDFNTPNTPIPLEPYQAPAGVAAAVNIVQDAGAVRLTNTAGGSFGVRFKVPAFDADVLTDLFFDYRMSPDVKVDIFFRVNGIYHGVQFSGPGVIRPGSKLLGRMDAIKADGQWHRAHIPVRAWLRAMYPGAASLKVEEVLTGNWNNQNYLLAGIGGNGPGATWSVDNVALVSAGVEEAQVQIGKAGQVRLDNGPARPAPANGMWKEKLAPGFHILSALEGNGSVSGAVPLLATSAPVVGKPLFRGNELVWPITNGAGLKTTDLKLTVDGKSVPLDGQYLSYDGDRGELVWQAGAAGGTWKDGTTAKLELTGLSDRLGRGPGTARGEARMDYKAHSGTVALPQVNIAGAPLSGTGSFETGLEDWGPGTAPAAIVERDDTTATDGTFSLRLTCPRSATPFSAVVRQTSFDAAQYPVITFNYKVQDRLRVDFKIMWEGRPYAINFTDSDNPTPSLGKIQGVKADEQWHSATIPLLQWMKALRPTATNFTVDSISVADEKWLGNARGVQWWVDEWRYVPAVKAPARATVTLADVTGIQALNWVVNTEPAATLEPVSQGAANIVLRGQGQAYLHVRAQNGAGNWSKTVHIPVLFSAEVP